MKLNPESVILEQLDGHWQKMAVFILWKLAKRQKVKITAADIAECAAAFAPGGPVMFTHGHTDSIEFQVIDTAAAERLAEHDANGCASCSGCGSIRSGAASKSRRHTSQRKFTASSC